VLLLALGSLGIVYGDIGTSPLYAFREAFEGHHLDVTPDGAIGASSLAFWALIVVITIKYLTLVMKADNKGEGGILALTSLLERSNLGRTTMVLTGLGIFGTALLYGDGMITPAISVLSAVEGLGVATSALEPWIIPIAVAILTGLFLIQKRGTAGIGRVFGPIMVSGSSPSPCSASTRSSALPTSSPPSTPFGPSASSRSTDGAASLRWAPSSSLSPVARRCTPTWATSAGAPSD